MLPQREQSVVARRTRALVRTTFVTLLLATTSCANFVGIKELDVDEPPAASGEATVPDATPGPPSDVRREANEVDATAPPIVSDAASGSPEAKKRVFITSDTVRGSFGGILRADAICAQAAIRGQLGGSWVAWLSGSLGDKIVNAIDRIPHDGPFHDLLDSRIALDKNQLRLGLYLPITIDERKGTVDPAHLRVWTGTNAWGKWAAGFAGGTCFNWGNDFPVVPGISGALNNRSGGWTDNGPTGCNTMGHLYCFEL